MATDGVGERRLGQEQEQQQEQEEAGWNVRIETGSASWSSAATETGSRKTSLFWISSIKWQKWAEMPNKRLQLSKKSELK